MEQQLFRASAFGDRWRDALHNRQLFLQPDDESNHDFIHEFDGFGQFRNPDQRWCRVSDADQFRCQFHQCRWAKLYGSDRSGHQSYQHSGRGYRLQFQLGLYAVALGQPDDEGDCWLGTGQSELFNECKPSLGHADGRHDDLYRLPRHQQRNAHRLSWGEIQH